MSWTPPVLLPSRHLLGVFLLALLLPVLALGLVLERTYRSDAQERTLVGAQNQAVLLAQTVVQPLIGERVQVGLLDEGTADALAEATRRAVNDGDVTEIRLRDLSGDVLFATDVGGGGHVMTDIAAVAESRQPVAMINTPEMGGSGTGESLHVVAPVLAPAGGDVLAVLDVVLPYESVAAAIDEQALVFRLILTGGLAVLWTVSAALAVVVTRRMRQQIVISERLALHDSLTGLPNRAMFRTRAGAALRRAAETNACCAVAVLDLDRFKEVNDTLGHAAGDRLLVAVGNRLRDAIRSDDTVARLGGDEFGVILPGADALTAATLLHDLRRLVMADLELDGLTLSVGVSVGLAISPDHGATLEELLRRADAAMYTAKRLRTGVAIAARREEPCGQVGQELAADLRHAIDADELVLHYQPKLTLNDGGIRSVEALVRWQHPNRGLLFPADFLPLAEDSGLVDDLTVWVLAEALRQLVAWDVEGIEVDVAVNVSSRTLHDPQFPALVAAALEHSGLAPARLTLEMTETALIEDMTAVREVLGRLRECGVGLSMDDFGAGSTSLSFLKFLPLTELKIDRMFVASLLSDPLDQSIVRAIIGVAHQAGLSVVAEGVETDPTRSELQGLDCDIVQGYGICRPAPAVQVVEVLRRAARQEVGR